MLRGTAVSIAMLGIFLLVVGSASAVVRTITPAATAFTGALVSGTTADFVAGSTSIKCTASTLSGTTKSPASTVATVSGPTGITFSGCNPFLGGSDVGNASAVTSGTWTIEVANDTATCDAADNPKICAVVLTIGSVSLTATTLLGSCTITAKGVSVGSEIYNLLRRLKIAAQTLPFTTDGGLSCPVSPASFSAEYQLNPGTLSIT